MVKKGNKKRKSQSNTSNRLNFIGFCLTATGLLISLSFNIYQCNVEQPQLAELSRLKNDFPMVSNIYEVMEISKDIPLPESLEDTKHLDYFPTVLLNTNLDPSGSFESTKYGFVLRLNTSKHKYLATNSSDNVSVKNIVFDLGELRDMRNELKWFLYEGPFPPEGWTTFN